MVAVNNNNRVDNVLDVVMKGLSKNPKQLPSWLFYDEQGDKLFQQIMKLPEYYLTRSETEILNTHKDSLTGFFTADDSAFDLVELGAGDGTKTEILLSYLLEKNVPFTYVPVDVSQHVLELLKSRLKGNFPEIELRPVNTRIETVQHHLSAYTRKVFLYLGANIGNFTFADARRFVHSIANQMKERDLLMIGFDLQKDPRTIVNAYDDSKGVTRDFNLNLLVRINRELGADFVSENFAHYPTYDPETGVTKSFLVSKVDQEVRFALNDHCISFRKWETIHTEVSLKYDVSMIEELAYLCGLTILHHFYDSAHNFCDILFQRVR